LLRHPIMMSVKTAVRDLTWSVKADVPANPPIPEHVRSVLFVCLGNICRSPFARELAARRLKERGHATIASRSAGIRTTQANRAPAEACAAAAAYGIELDTHAPAQLTTKMMDEADMVVVMEAAHFNELQLTYPAHRARLFLLPIFDKGAGGAHARYNIADPYGRPLHAFEMCYRRISSALDHFLPSILRSR